MALPYSLEVEAMAWMRWGMPRMTHVATQAGNFSADVLGANDKELLEVEVKRSRSDFRADFKKTEKHSKYADPPPGRALWVPNRFYYLVGPELREAGLEILAEKGCPAGLLVLVNPMTEASGKWYGRGHILVAKRAPKIHDRQPSAGILRQLAKRMASESVALRIRVETGTFTDEDVQLLKSTGEPYEEELVDG